MNIITELAKGITKIKYIGKSDSCITKDKFYDVIYIDFEDGGIYLIDNNKQLSWVYFDDIAGNCNFCRVCLRQ